MKQSIIKEKSYQFAIRMVKFYTLLKDEKKEYILSKQILRSGTAIGALVEEALQAESTADFIHKLSIANKEANETRYWLRLLKDTGIIDKNEATTLITDCEELIKMLVSIIKTSKAKIQR